jgi:hypothetical protein
MNEWSGYRAALLMFVNFVVFCEERNVGRDAEQIDNAE